jgi:hypothetical protein
MTPPHSSHNTSACRCRPRTPAPADAPYSVVRVKGSAGPVKGELEVTSSEPQGSPVSTAIAILILVTAAALAAVAAGVVGWLTGFPAVAAGLAAFGAFALIFGVGLYITYWRVRPGVGHESPRRAGCRSAITVCECAEVAYYDRSRHNEHPGASVSVGGRPLARRANNRRSQ